MTESSNPLPLLEQALVLVTADHAEASFSEAREASTRFANNRITQNVSRKEASVTVKVDKEFQREIGEKVGIGFDDRALHLFDGESGERLG